MPLIISTTDLSRQHYERIVKQRVRKREKWATAMDLNKAMTYLSSINSCSYDFYLDFT